MNFYKKIIGAAALCVALIGLGAISPAHAAIDCSEAVGTGGTVYPLDGGTHAFRCRNTVTGIKPTDQRRDTLFNTLKHNNFPAAVRAKLKAKNVKYFFFNNRSEANQYFAATAPYHGPYLATGNDFQSTTARCANTGAVNSFTNGHLIAVAIYDKCQLDTFAQEVVNPSLERTALHESGHALDYSLAPAISPNTTPSSRMNNISLYDQGKLTPSTWTGLDVDQRDDYVCKLFRPNHKPSQIEQDLGAHMDGVSPGGQVCTLTSPPHRDSDYVGATQPDDATPQQIAIAKLTYFITLKKETWAEYFVIDSPWSISSPAAFLQFTDGVLGNTNPIITPRPYNCFRAVVAAYVANPDSPTIVLPPLCPAMAP